jgi:hypothetical protein
MCDTNDDGRYDLNTGKHQRSRQIGPLCQNSTAPTLPATSDNGFAGTWNLQQSVQQQLNDTYTFTPTDPCALNDDGRYYHNTGNTSVHADRTSLSE